jgi:hypothetical protein
VLTSFYGSLSSSLVSLFGSSKHVGFIELSFSFQVGPLRCWPGGLCLSRSIGDLDVGECIIAVPHVKQVKACSSENSYLHLTWLASCSKN